MAADMQSEYRTIRRDVLIFEHLKKIEKEGGAYEALYLSIHSLQNQNLRAVNRQALQDTFASLSPEAKAKAFMLHNDDLIVVFSQKCHDEILSCLVKVRFMFHDDPLLKDAEDLQQAGFARIFDLASEKGELRSRIRAVVQAPQPAGETDIKFPRIVPVSVFNTSSKKAKRELTPEMLAKVQKILSVADFSSFIRRQSICAIIGKSVPQRVFEEVYVSIPDLREMLLPDVDLTSNPWLFLSLSETLDKRVLETISRHDDGSLIGNFSVNINVSTILSDDFLAFDDNINVSMRSSIILELQLVDIFSDIKAFILAKTFAQARGYKVCIDGITVDKLKYLNRTNLNCDLMKIIWHPSFMDVIHVQRLLSQHAPKTIFSIKK